MPGFFHCQGALHAAMAVVCKNSIPVSDKPAQFTAPPSGLFGGNGLYDGDKEQDMRLPVFSVFRKAIAFAQVVVDESAFKNPGGSHERLCRKISRG